jgi:hypothetical protein
MIGIYPPKARILFPNSWAVESFMLRLKRNLDWHILAEANAKDFKIKPKGVGHAGWADHYILIGLSKARSGIEVFINAEKLRDHSSDAWDAIFEQARYYRS